MDPDQPRQALAVSALAGAVFWGMFHLATTLWAGQPVERSDLVRAFANVGMGMLAGVLAAVFLGPALAPLVPVAGLRDPYVVGFGLGAGAWEVAPFAYGLLRSRAKRASREKR